MGDKIYVPLDQLTELAKSLDLIVSELSEASKLQNNLEAAIGNPAGDSQLRDKCDEFEGRWDDKRNKLVKQLTNVRDHVADTVTGVTEGDQVLSKGLEPTAASPSPTTTN